VAGVPRHGDNIGRHCSGADRLDDVGNRNEHVDHFAGVFAQLGKDLLQRALGSLIGNRSNLPLETGAVFRAVCLSSFLTGFVCTRCEKAAGSRFFCISNEIGRCLHLHGWKLLKKATDQTYQSMNCCMLTTVLLNVVKVHTTFFGTSRCWQWRHIDHSAGGFTPLGC
jgi:hypothetical protein